MSESTRQELEMKRSQLRVNVVALLFAAVGAVSTIFTMALSFGSHQRSQEQIRLNQAQLRLNQEQAREQSLYKLASLEYQVSFECNPGEDDELVETFRVTNLGRAVENVRIHIDDTGVEVLEARSIEPDEAVPLRVYTHTVPMEILVPEVRLNPGQWYEMQVALANYGGITGSQILEIFYRQREAISITTDRGPLSETSSGHLQEDISGIPELRVHRVEAPTSIEEIASKYDLNVDTLVLLNPWLEHTPPTEGQIVVIQSAVCGPPTFASRMQPNSLAPLGVHQVRQNESLYCIARAYEVSPWSLAEMNGIRLVDGVETGHLLNIPGAHIDFPEASSLPKCGRQFDRAEPPNSCSWYKLQEGDTLYGLAWKFGTNVWAIVHTNPEISNPNDLSALQFLCIPVP